MSFLTEYFDEYRLKPINKQKPCLPEYRYTKLEGKTWLDPKMGTKSKEYTDEENQAFINKTMKSLRGQSAYFIGYCAHLDQTFKTREFIPHIKKKRPCKEEVKVASVENLADTGPKLALKDTEVMKIAHDLYEKNLDAPTLQPLDTGGRVFGYIRPRLYKTGFSEYQNSIARLAYELVRDDRIPRYVASNGNRPKWGYPPEAPRQPELDGIPLDGERLF